MYRPCKLEHIVNSVIVYITHSGKVVGVYSDKREALIAAASWHGACSIMVDGYSAYPWFEPVPEPEPPAVYSYVVLYEQEHREWIEEYGSYGWEYRWEVHRVFSTNEKAEAYIKTQKGDYKIEEVLLDAA